MTMHQSSSHFSSSPSLQITPMSVSSAMPAFDSTGMDQVSLTRLQQVIGLLDSSLRLPDNPRAFMVYFLGLVIVFAGAFMHVMISAQIMQAEFTLSQLQEEYLAIEQQNGDIIFQIARDTNMARLQERVIQSGYVPVQEREYVFVPGETTANIAQSTALAQDSAQASVAVAPEAISATTEQPIATIPATNFGGQLTQWEAFWSNLMRGGDTSGPSPIASAPASSKATATTLSANRQLSNTGQNFWSVWWEQASAQGEKLLEQFSGQ